MEEFLTQINALIEAAKAKEASLKAEYDKDLVKLESELAKAEKAAEDERAEVNALVGQDKLAEAHVRKGSLLQLRLNAAKAKKALIERSVTYDAVNYEFSRENASQLNALVSQAVNRSLELHRQIDDTIADLRQLTERSLRNVENFNSHGSLIQKELEAAEIEIQELRQSALV